MTPTLPQTLNVVVISITVQKKDDKKTYQPQRNSCKRTNGRSRRKRSKSKRVTENSSTNVSRGVRIMGKYMKTARDELQKIREGENSHPKSKQKTAEETQA